MNKESGSAKVLFLILDLSDNNVKYSAHCPQAGKWGALYRGSQATWAHSARHTSHRLTTPQCQAQENFFRMVGQGSASDPQNSADDWCSPIRLSGWR